MNNIVETAFLKTIENILLKNYGDLSEIHYGFYGDENQFYFNGKNYYCVRTKPYLYSLEECTEDFLEKEIKKIIDKAVEAYECHLKFLELLPDYVDCPHINSATDKEDIKLRIYFEDCYLMRDQISVILGCMIL